MVKKRKRSTKLATVVDRWNKSQVAVTTSDYEQDHTSETSRGSTSTERTGGQVTNGTITLTGNHSLEYVRKIAEWAIGQMHAPYMCWQDIDYRLRRAQEHFKSFQGRKATYEEWGVPEGIQICVDTMEKLKRYMDDLVQNLEKTQASTKQTIGMTKSTDAEPFQSRAESKETRGRFQPRQVSDAPMPINTANRDPNQGPRNRKSPPLVEVLRKQIQRNVGRLKVDEHFDNEDWRRYKMKDTMDLIKKYQELIGEYEQEEADTVIMEGIIKLESYLKRVMSQHSRPESSTTPTFLRNESQQAVVVPSVDSDAEQLEQCKTRLNNIDKVCDSIFKKTEQDYLQKEIEHCEKIRKEHEANLEKEISKIEEDFRLQIEAAMDRIAKQHEIEVAQVEADAKESLDRQLKSLDEIRIKWTNDINEETKADIDNYRQQCQAKLDEQVKGLQEQCSADIQEYADNRIEADRIWERNAIATFEHNQPPDVVDQCELPLTLAIEQPMLLPGKVSTLVSRRWYRALTGPKDYPGVLKTDKSVRKQRTSYVIDRGKRDASSPVPGLLGTSGHDQPGTTSEPYQLGTVPTTKGISYGPTRNDVFDRGKRDRIALGLSGDDPDGQDLEGVDYEPPRKKLPPDRTTRGRGGIGGEV
jgi:hypothetical protein